jgi:methylmalonyl-CoA/ethylmalonyl-CoA epimerase
MATKLNHIAIVVEDIDKALQVYQDAIGLPLSAVNEEPAEAVKVAYFPTETGEVELIQPTTTDSGVAKYLAKKGEGMHHVCLEVDSIEETTKIMTAKGMEVLGEIRTNKRGDRYIFIHPKSAHGVLIELYEPAGRTQ